jgi:hypothetical protein
VRSFLRRKTRKGYRLRGMSSIMRGGGRAVACDGAEECAHVLKYDKDELISPGKVIFRNGPTTVILPGKYRE